MKFREQLGVLLGALATASMVIVLAAVPASASLSSSKQAVTSSGDPSGIGMPRGGPSVLVNRTYYNRALKSDNWGKTPDGLVFKSCVYQIPTGGKIDSTHNMIIEASGAMLPAPPCPYARLVKPETVTATKQSGSAAPAAINPDSPDDWLGWARYITSTALTRMGTTYAVPYPPTTPGAVDYIFTDFQDHALTSILQPVVGFGPTAGENGSTIGGNYMWQAPYYLWSGNLAVGDLQQVYTNDTIGGSLTSSGCNSGGGHCNWNIAVHDLTTGHLISSTLAINSSAVYSVFDGAVLEADAMGCKELFSNHHAVFRNISGTSQGGAVSPSWNFYTDGQCSMYLTGSGANLDILWTS